MSVALFGTVPHVAVAHRGHGNHGPPESVRNGFEEGLFRTGLSEIHSAREQYDSWNTEEKRGRRSPAIGSVKGPRFYND